MQIPLNLDFLKEFDEKYLPPTNAWNMCCDGYFNLLGIERNQMLVDAIKPYFGHVFKEYKLSLLGAMIAFGEIIYYQYMRYIYEKKKRFAETNVQDADKFLFLKIHSENLMPMCKFTNILIKEFTQMHEDINKMMEEMQYVPNYENMPKLPPAMSMFGKRQ